MRQAFLDPASGRTCELVLPPGGKVFPAAGEPKIGVRHPDCPAVADLCIDLDAFWCPACKWNGRISGAWAVDMIRGTGRCWNCPAEFVIGDGYGEPAESQVFCSESCAAQYTAELGA